MKLAAAARAAWRGAVGCFVVEHLTPQLESTEPEPLTRTRVPQPAAKSKGRGETRRRSGHAAGEREGEG